MEVEPPSTARRQGLLPGLGDEAQPLPRTSLSQLPEIGLDDAADARVAPGGLGIGQQQYGLSTRGHLDDAGQDPVGGQFPSTAADQFGPIEANPHAVAGGIGPPVRLPERVHGGRVKLVEFRARQDAQTLIRRPQQGADGAIMVQRLPQRQAIARP